MSKTAYIVDSIQNYQNGTFNRIEVRTLTWLEMSYNKYQSDEIVESKQRPAKKSLSDTYNLRLQKRQEMERKRQERLKNKCKGEQ